jgi:hypothetical protein
MKPFSKCAPLAACLKLPSIWDPPLARTFLNRFLFVILGLHAFELSAQTPIEFGQTRLDLQMAVGQSTAFTFSGSAAQLIAIQMTEVSGDFEPTFDLLSPTGEILKTIINGSSARLLRYMLPVGGTYTILCRDNTGSYGGGYNLTLVDCLGLNPAENDGGLINSAQLRSATMVPSDIDVLSFSGAAGQLATIQMTEVSGDFEPTFELLSPTGSLLKTVVHGSSARLEPYALPSCGTYRIICLDNTGSYGGGYNLSLTLIGPDVCDSDKDGLPDDWERQYFSDLRYGPDDDPDNDGLTNAQELAKKTDPSKADTDSDGFGDGVEVARNSDPLDEKSKPFTALDILVKTVDIEFIPLAGSRYQLQASEDHKTWINIGSPIEGDNSLFRTNIEIRGSRYKFFHVNSIE